jgi:hypothetical protein
MWEDPIVAEVRKIREKLAARFNYDIDALFDYLREQEKTSGHPIVSPPRRAKSKRGAAKSPRRRTRLKDR